MTDTHVNYDPCIIYVYSLRVKPMTATMCNIRTDSPPATAFNSTIYNYYLLGEPNLVLMYVQRATYYPVPIYTYTYL